MNVRLVLIAAATLMSTSAFAAADNGKPQARPSPQPQNASPQVVLASADEVRAPAPADAHAEATPKHRIARVTTCRCGDQEAQPEQQ